jgi:hypothetical protein
MMEPGTYIALSLGQFIQLLVDNGDVAVVTQILEDGPKTADGAFVRRMELILIPDGLVKRTLADYEEIPVHKVLAGLLARQIVT